MRTLDQIYYGLDDGVTVHKSIDMCKGCSKLRFIAPMKINTDGKVHLVCVGGPVKYDSLLFASGKFSMARLDDMDNRDRMIHDFECGSVPAECRNKTYAVIGKLKVL